MSSNIEAAKRKPPTQTLFRLGGLALGIAIVAAGALLPKGSWLAILLFDYRDGAVPPFPVTISCLEWLVFGIGCGELAGRYLHARAERKQLGRSLLPERDDAMIDPRALPGIARSIRATGRDHYLQRLLLRVIWQFQGTRSIGLAAEIMDSTLELQQHELDLGYNLSRYLTWLLPTVGFIGTVWGLSRGLAGMKGMNPQDPEQFQKMLEVTIGDLSLAFNTTFIALVLASVLVLALQLIQEFEERTLNEVGQYAIDHLLNKLYAEDK